MMISKKTIAIIIPLVIFLSGMVMLGQGAYIYAKASIAQLLIHNAWEKLQQHHNTQLAKPWPWADTFPVAKLTINNELLYVLNSTSGESLSFGPGHYLNSVLPGQKGDSIVAGHRDTHFALLQQLQKDDIVMAESYLGDTQTYKIKQIEVIDSDKQQISINKAINQLQLVTCYPFDSIDSSSPLRYVITAGAIY